MTASLLQFLRSIMPRSLWHASVLKQIASLESRWRPLTDHELRRESLALRYRAQSGEQSHNLLPEAYSLVREASRRTLNMRHFDVQIAAGLSLHSRSVAEMQTGEGKTLTATLPVYVAALTGEGVHVATANDYLAVRDSQLVRPLFELLGLSVGVVDSSTPRSQRSSAYQADITYGTAREFGFDFLRDRLAVQDSQDSSSGLLSRLRGGDALMPRGVQRKLHFALIDEADSILIDEARTPLIIASIAGPESSVRAAYSWAASIALKFERDQHFEIDSDHHQITLSPSGRRFVRELAKPTELADLPLYDLYEFVERAIRAQRDFQRDRHYVIRNDEITIVDEFTGRLAEGRKWRDGLHQAIEAKEGLPISMGTGELARVSVQNFFRQYKRVAGMTGTAWSARREFRTIYGLTVERIPTNRPNRRAQWPDAVYGTDAARWKAIVDEVRVLHDAGRPVLIGTRSIDKSEQLATMLEDAHIEHRVLNARHPAAEAEIITTAGGRGQVTVATNMAGRGTDIQLDAEVVELGGLHVICSELHESARIDRQLIGRCARQGDPGSYRQVMSLEDEILEKGLGERTSRRLKELGSRIHGTANHYAGTFRRAQSRIEASHFRQRRLLLYLEKERLERQHQLGQDPYLERSDQ